MFVYEKRLQYPVKIKNTNPKLASLIISQYGGPYSIRLRKSRSKSAPAFTIRCCSLFRLFLIHIFTALEKLCFPSEQRIQIGGLQPCCQLTALLIVQVIRIDQLIPNMYERYRPYLLFFRHTVHLPV